MNIVTADAVSGLIFKFEMQHYLLCTVRKFIVIFIAALHSRCGHYIFNLWFLFFSSPNLSRHRLDVYHTCTHDVALVRI